MVGNMMLILLELNKKAILKEEVQDAVNEMKAGKIPWLNVFSF